MTLSLPHRAYLLASTLLGPLARPILNKRLRRGKEDPDRLTERLGKASRPRPAGTLIWMHGASIGEAMSMLPLIQTLLAARKDASILVTTGTVTSAHRLTKLLPDRAFHQFVPVDTRNAVTGFLDHWIPDLAIWIESEFWPRLVTDTAARGIPMALVNARFSARSIQGWRKAPRMLRNLLACFRLIRTQDRETLERLAPFTPSAQFSGNLKALIETPECDHAEFTAIRQIIGDRPVWLAASTHSADEPVILAAQRILLDRCDPSPLLVLAPRHPERGLEIRSAIRQADFGVAIRSEGVTPNADTDIWLADTLGEMGLWYRFAPVTFVAGSVGNAGGHTPFEPILLDSAVLHGPNVANFAPTYRALREAGAARLIEDAGELADAVQILLTEEAAFAAMIEAARAVHEAVMPDLEELTRDVLALTEAEP